MTTANLLQYLATRPVESARISLVEARSAMINAANELDAITALCALASIGTGDQSVVERVRAMHAELGAQIERGDRLERERDILQAELDRRELVKKALDDFYASAEKEYWKP